MPDSVTLTPEKKSYTFSRGDVKTAYTMGIDVGGTKTAYGLFDDDRQLLHRREEISDPSISASEFLDGIVRVCHEMSEEQDIQFSDMRGIGIGVPSYVLYEEGRIIKTANLPNLRDVPARAYLMEKLGGNIRILLDNDSHTGALAEHRHGAGRGFKHMLYCPVSTGISSGIIINNELFRGRYGWSGESGHMIVTPGEGIECGCGNRGCLMSYCSGSMIVKHIQQKIADGEKSVMVEIAEGAGNITAHTVLEAYDQGDRLAEWAIQQMSEYMAVWIYNLYEILNINCFVFGGGLLNFGDRLFPRIWAQFDKYNKNDLPVYFRAAELGKNFGIIGAAELLFQ